MDRNSIRSAYDKQDYPELKLEEGELVELAFKRSKICYAILWGGIGIAIIVILLAILILISSGVVKDQMGENFVSFISVALFIILMGFGVMSTYVHKHNKMFITNKRITQFTMASPVVSSVNIIDLSSIEDVSFRQNKLIEKLFHYGTLRLSTVGDETTYTFPYAVVSPEEISHIVKLVDTDKENRNN